MKSNIQLTIKRNIIKYIDALETDQVLVVCDQSLIALYKDFILSIKKHPKVIFYKSLSGEKQKTFEHYQKTMEFFLKKGIHRKTHVLTIGGGSTSDFGGFLAATLLRGIEWSAVPTTLLSMIDASIGGKVGINSQWGKNLIGHIHFPQNIFICYEFLNSLPDLEFESGKGELLKYALLSKKIHDLVLEKKDLGEIILECARYKQEIVEKDPYEKFERKFLNLGHTFGHALEKQKKIPHGHGVCMGIKLVDKIYQENSLKNTIKELSDALEIKVPKNIEINKETIDYLKRDKKRLVNDQIEMVFLGQVGYPYLKKISISDFDQLV